MKIFLPFQQQAAATSVYCAVARELQGIGGHYFNNCFQCEPSKEATNEKTMKALWDISTKLVSQSTDGDQ